MSSTTACCAPATPPSSWFAQAWPGRMLATALRRLQAAAPWRWPALPAPEELDLYSLAYLSDATLKDIGVPDGLRAYAAQRHEQAELLRQIEMHRGAVGEWRW